MGELSPSRGPLLIFGPLLILGPSVPVRLACSERIGREESVALEWGSKNSGRLLVAEAI